MEWKLISEEKTNEKRTTVYAAGIYDDNNQCKKCIVKIEDLVGISTYNSELVVLENTKLVELKDKVTGNVIGYDIRGY